MFRTHRWVRVPRIIAVEPGRPVNDDMDVDREIEVPLPMLIRERLAPIGVLAIMNNNVPGLDGVRQMPRGMPFIDQLLALPPPGPPRPLYNDNGLRGLPRVEVRRLEELNDGNHKLEFKILRHKYQSEAAERGIIRSLV